MTFFLACSSACSVGFLDRDEKEGDKLENSKDLMKGECDRVVRAWACNLVVPGSNPPCCTPLLTGFVLGCPELSP